MSEDPFDDPPIRFLRAEFPDATAAECLRFFRASKQKLDIAKSRLARYFEWRRDTAAAGSTQKKLGVELPAWVTPLSVKAHDGSHVVLCQTGRCDPKAGTPNEYAHATATTLDNTLPRDSLDRFSLIVDVAGIQGGHNMPGSSLIPTLRALSSVLGAHLPERMQKIVIYPVTWTMRSVWAAVKPFLDPVTASKAVLLGQDCPPHVRRYPIALGEYIPLDAIAEDDLARQLVMETPPLLDRSRTQGG